MITKEHIIDCTGDACTGDEVSFKRALFVGEYPNSTYIGEEHITGKIIKESYGDKKQQHTFTIQKENGVVIKIKGRNLYKNGVHRKKWFCEDQRKLIIDEKHDRGEKARTERLKRMNKNNFYL